MGELVKEMKELTGSGAPKKWMSEVKRAVSFVWWSPAQLLSSINQNKPTNFIGLLIDEGEKGVKWIARQWNGMNWWVMSCAPLPRMNAAPSIFDWFLFVILAFSSFFKREDERRVCALPLRSRKVCEWSEWSSLCGPLFLNEVKKRGSEERESWKNEMEGRGALAGRPRPLP